MIKIAVIGQGFVGLPLALSFAIKGTKVMGVDINENLVRELNYGVTYHKEQYKEKSIKDILKEQLSLKNYIAMNSIEEAMKESNVIILTVGIPIVKGTALLDEISIATAKIGKNLKKGDLIIVRSTVIPGTTEDVILPILEKSSGLKCGEDFYLAYSSERIAEGKAFDEFENMPTVVAGINRKSTNMSKEVLRLICNAEIIEASNIKVVETSKVFENVQRDVNIAMVQEFARFTEKIGIDIFEVIDIANTHKRVNLLTPGPGVGGYCIPNAYYYLKPKAEELDLELNLLKIARKTNEQIPELIVSKANKVLNSIGKDIKSSNIAVIGIAMKDYSNDFRLSPAEKIIDLLIEKGACVKAFDPEVKIKRKYIMSNLSNTLDRCDLILILAKQESIDFGKINEFAMYKDIHIIDTKNVYKNLRKDIVRKYNKV